WTGAGAASADADVLVFLDADTQLDPGGLSAIVGDHARRGGLVSVQPFHRTERPYEALSALFNIVPWMGLAAATPTAARRSPPGAFGPCLVTTAEDYRAVGGHEAVRGEVVEDVALAANYRAAGLPVATLAGSGTISFRMYPDGVGQLIEGWTKNIAGGAGASRPAAMALAVLWIAGCISTVTGAAIAPGIAAVTVYAAYAAQIAWMLARLGRFPWWTAPAFPVPLAFFLAVFARSLVLTNLRGEVRWRGRTIRTKPKPRPR
ncbi:MAG: glycosyltransferase, partial [Acidimicrobiales bacterium]